MSLSEYSPLSYPAQEPVLAVDATNLAGGTANAIPYQTGPNTTAFLSGGTGVLQESAGAPTWTQSPALASPTATTQTTTDSSTNVATTGFVHTAIQSSPHMLAHSPISSLGLMPTAGNSTQAGDGTYGVIFNVQLPALGPFFGCKLIYLNYDTVNTQNWDGVKVAPAGANISVGNNALTFTGYVTVGGSQAFGVPVATTGAGGQLIPGVTITDFIQVTSGSVNGLRVASHIKPSSNSTNHPNYNSTYYAALNTLTVSTGLAANAVYVFSGSGAALSNLTTTTNSTLNSGGDQNPIAAIFYYSTIKTDVFWFGDSIVQGYGTTSTYAGMAEYTTFNSFGNTTQYGGANFATTGQTTVDTMARLKTVIGANQPKYAAFKPWSPNDGNTSAAFNASWGYTLEMVNFCLQNNVIPVVVTAPFATGYSNTLITAQNTLVKALPSSVIVVDAYNILTPGGVWVSGYNSGDSIHPNDAGESAVATAFINATPF